MSEPESPGPAPPRPEYPRPQLVREAWQNLNGPWELAFDDEDRGLAEGWESGRAFAGRVQVPFPIESELSGVAERTPRPRLWMRRRVELPAAWRGGRVALRVGACDHEARVFCNGREVGRHRGGYAPFACELGHALRPGVNELVMRVEDADTWTQPRGKQATAALRTPVDYDRVTGVWQTVWLEPLPALSIDDVWTRFDRSGGELAVYVALSQPAGATVRAELRDGDVPVAAEERPTGGRPEIRLPLRVPAPRLWSPDDPHLYTLVVELREGGRALDRVRHPVGLREVAAADGALWLNGRRLFVRGVLDQGYFPGGWYTAASDADLRRDVELTRALGFNVARKHQKAEDPRYLHWADRLGLLVWSEQPSGRDFTTGLVRDLASEWAELVRRDRGHACVMSWVPFNESWGVWSQARRPEQRALVEALTALTRALDPTRPVVGNDGWEYAAGDLYTLHLYAGEEPPDGRAGPGLAERLRALIEDPWSPVLPAGHPLGERCGALPGADPRGLPVLVTECGGIGTRPAEADAREPFAYGALASGPAELEARIARELDALRACEGLSGFVWTQLTDVQQEVNGLLDFRRRPKLALARCRELFGSVG